MSRREPWTNPLSIRERMGLRSDMLRYRLRSRWTEKIPRGIAFRLPWRVKFWAMISVAAEAAEADADADGTSPSEVTYRQMHDAWIAKHEKGQGA